MARVYKETRQTVVQNTADPELMDDTTEERSAADADYGMTVAQRVVYFIGGVIIALLALRFLLSLMGANRENTFAAFIYDASRPFAAPFFGLFDYQQQYGVSRFEFETLIAIVVWGLITLGVARLVTLGRHSS